MISKIMEFKTAIWEKTEEYTTGRGQRVLLAALMGIGTIAWKLLRFTWSLLEVIFVDDKKNKSSSIYLQEEEETDLHGRKRGNFFYGEGMPDIDVLEEMEEYEKRHMM